MKGTLKKRFEDSGDLFSNFKSRINLFFDDFFGDLETTTFFKSDFSPRIDIDEDEKNIYVTAEIPGAKKEDIEVEIKDNVLTIKGEKKEEKEEKDKKKRIYHKETVYGSFNRTMTLPEKVDSEKAKASFKNGLLKLEIPKIVDESGKQKIKID